MCRSSCGRPRRLLSWRVSRAVGYISRGLPTRSCCRVSHRNAARASVKCGIVSAGTTSATKLDPAFVREFLRGIPGDEEPQVHVFATDPGSRVLLKCGPYTGVIMPLAEET
jgi:hypothetical protein